MADRDEILEFLNQLLRPSDFDDTAPSGLQVPGAQEVTRVVTAVSAQLDLFEQARDQRAEMVLVHHGLFWDFHPRALSPQMATRLKCLLSSNINLVAYHLPLDANRDVGNNILLCRSLGFEPLPEAFGYYRGQPLGVIGRNEGVSIDQVRGEVRQLTGSDPLVFASGPDTIQRVGIVSGGASSALPEAITKGLDAFLTGEPSEHVMAEAREGRIHYIAAGHYNTETLGVKRLGTLLAQQFGLEHSFIDIPNPV